jgi:hypothetical protein
MKCPRGQQDDPSHSKFCLECGAPLRCYVLRYQEPGMIKPNPQKIIAQDTDWRFLHALKKE